MEGALVIDSGKEMPIHGAAAAGLFQGGAHHSAPFLRQLRTQDLITFQDLFSCYLVLLAVGKPWSWPFPGLRHTLVLFALSAGFPQQSSRKADSLKGELGLVTLRAQQHLQASGSWVPLTPGCGNGIASG